MCILVCIDTHVYVHMYVCIIYQYLYACMQKESV